MQTRHTLRWILVLAALAIVAAVAWQWRYSLIPLKIGIEGNYPPFTQTLPDGRVEGFEIDLARSWCDSIHARCVLQPMEFDSLLPAVADGKIDAAIASITITPERSRVVDFSIPYYSVPSAFIVPTSAKGLMLAGGLDEKRIAVLKGSPREAWLRTNYPAAVFKVVSKEAEVYDQLRTGEADLAFGSMLVAKTRFLASPEGKGFVVAGSPIWLDAGVAIALPKGKRDLRASFDNAIAQFNRDGRFDTLSARYFDFPVRK